MKTATKPCNNATCNSIHCQGRHQPRTMRGVFGCLNNFVRHVGRTTFREVGTTVARGQHGSVDLIEGSGRTKGTLAVRIWASGEFCIWGEPGVDAVEFFRDFCLPERWYLGHRAGQWVVYVDRGGYDEVHPIKMFSRTRIAD